MNMKKTLAAAALAVGLAAAPAAAQRHGGMHGQGPGMGAGFGMQGRMLERAAVVLELTDAQKQFAQKLAEDTRAKAQPLVQQLREGRQELAAAVKSNNQGAIDNLTVRNANVSAQLSALHAKAMASFYAQLTPEQKAKADALHANRGKAFKQRGERMKQRGDATR